MPPAPILDLVSKDDPSVNVRRVGALLVGHGTRDARGVSEFLKLAELVAQRVPDSIVRPGFLELASPGIAAAVSELVACGVDSLVVVPVLLFAAGHAKEDVPRAVEDALRRVRSTIRHVQAAHLGTHASVVALSGRRFLQATAKLDAIPGHETMRLLVGRGSRDPLATEEMFQFSALSQQPGGQQLGVHQQDGHQQDGQHRAGRQQENQQQHALPHVTTAFYAMAEPRFEAVVEALKRQPYRRIVVQPHVLFHGQILERMVQMVDDANRESPQQEWVMCEHLGPAPSLADALVDRFREANVREAPSGRSP